MIAVASYEFKKSGAFTGSSDGGGATGALNNIQLIGYQIDNIYIYGKAKMQQGVFAIANAQTLCRSRIIAGPASCMQN